MHNKNDSDEKGAVKKASDHREVDMFTPDLQFGTAFILRFIHIGSKQLK